MNNKPKSKAGKDSAKCAVQQSFEYCAWVHRHQRPSWLFRPDPRYRKLSHTTRTGITYVIVSGLEYGKPFWIGRILEGLCFSVDKEIRAREIEFADGGRYVFPNT